MLRDISSVSAIGFWSYAHDDNKLDDGAILKLASAIEDEYSLITGQPLKLFVDQNSLDWGDTWRERIDSALLQTTFFIPIITPRYFSRPECRRELLEFAAKASSLGVSEFLLPILYVKPTEFSRDNSDNAVSLVAGIQYVDWQYLRLADPNSREFRKSVNELAKRLRRISNDVAERQLREEMNYETSHPDSADGIADLVDRIMHLFPDWLESVMSDNVMLSQMQATWVACLARVDKLERANYPASATLSARIRTAKEMMPLLQRYNQAAKIYLERSIQLDPSVTALARLLADHPENFDLANPISESIDEAVENINNKMVIQATRNSDPGVAVPMNHELKSWAHFGRIFQESYAISTKAQAAVVEGNEIVMRWDVELRRAADRK